MGYYLPLGTFRVKLHRAERSPPRALPCSANIRSRQVGSRGIPLAWVALGWRPRLPSRGSRSRGMPRVVNPTRADAQVGCAVGGRWHGRNGRIVGDPCPCHGVLKNGDRGCCFVRQDQGDRTVRTADRSSPRFCVDPIEKKPLFHFHLRSVVLQDRVFIKPIRSRAVLSSAACKENRHGSIHSSRVSATDRARGETLFLPILSAGRNRTNLATGCNSHEEPIE